MKARPMTKKSRGRGGCLIRALLVMLLTPVVLVMLWVLLGYFIRGHSCAKLDNGLNLGREAVFVLSRPHFRPLAVPRYSDGTPLVRGQVWSLNVTATTVFGRTDNFGFAWRADTGPVRSYEDSETYERLVAEAGKVNWGLWEGANVSADYMLHKIKRMPGFDVGWCPTALMRW